VDRIEVGRYSKEEMASHGYAGWINPARKAKEKVPLWMIFITMDGHVQLGIRNKKGDLEF
jgi:hypothetical protein